VGVVGANGKELIAVLNQNDFFAVGLARYHVSMAEIANWKSILQVGLCRLSGVSAMI
jgi:hypothetical protein